MQIYLLRHGEKRFDQERFNEIGWFDSDLTPFGEQQADATGRRLATFGIQHIYTSDLVRTRQTTQFANQHIGAPVDIRLELREIFLGDWEGKNTAGRRALDEEYFDAWQAHTSDLPYPNGENGSLVFFRTDRLLRELVQTPAEAILIVTHAGVIRSLVSTYLGLGIEKRFNLQIDHCSITTLSYNPEKQTFSLINLNDCAHLEGLASPE